MTEYEEAQLEHERTRHALEKERLEWEKAAERTDRWWRAFSVALPFLGVVATVAATHYFTTRQLQAADARQQVEAENALRRQKAELSAQRERVLLDRRAALCAELTRAAALVANHSWRSPEYDFGQGAVFRITSGELGMLNSTTVEGAALQFTKNLRDMVELRHTKTDLQMGEIKSKLDVTFRGGSEKIGRACGTIT